MSTERAQMRRPPRGAHVTGGAFPTTTLPSATTTSTSRSHTPTGLVTSSSPSSSPSSSLLRQDPDGDLYTLAQQRVSRCENKNLRAFMHQLPSSPKQLMRRLEEQQQAMAALREENIRLKGREVEVSSLTLRLQERIQATQNQVDHIKTQVQLQLSQPITEEEYQRIEALSESQRDLVDAMKLGVFRQLGALRASQQAAAKRAAELSTSVMQLQHENGDLKVRLAEHASSTETLQEKSERQTRLLASRESRIAELEGHIASVETKNKSLYLDQEHYLSAKLTAQVKTDEVARLAVRLEEAEMDVQRYRANAECTEQKLDILKAEYYELKLGYSQRVLELESALKASEEKIKALGDLEMESELFIANLAASSQGEVAFRTDAIAVSSNDAAAGRSTNAYESWLALPRSRKLAHTLVVTKRCLHLENKVKSLEHDLEFKQAQMARLQVALDGAREALHNINSPYVLVEKAMTELSEENERLKQRLRISEEEKKNCQTKLQQYGGQLRVLTHHRKELLRMKQLLRQLGMREGFVFPADTGDEPEEQQQQQQQRPPDRPPRTGSDGTSPRGATQVVRGEMDTSKAAATDHAAAIIHTAEAAPRTALGTPKPIEMQF